MPFPDALQEFKVETSASSAQNGVKSSGSVSLVTKSGTNEFHGDLFEFVRNGKFNARNAFATQARHHQAQPVRRNVGRSRSSKNKLFFFGGYQGTTMRQDPRTPSPLFRPRRCWPATLRPSLHPPATAAGRSR